MHDVHVTLLVPIREILIEEALSLIDLKEYALELLELFRIRSVGADLSGLLADSEDSVEVHFQVLPQSVTMISDNECPIRVDNRCDF